jgi:hypothetical protein
MRKCATGVLLVFLTAAVVPRRAAGEDGQSTVQTSENPVLTFFKQTEVSGFVDAYYSYNFNTPATPCAVVSEVEIFNCLHAFDVARQSLSLNLAELALDKKPTARSRGGYRLDLDYGPAATLVASTDPSGTIRYQHVQQAYLSYLAPVLSDRLQLDFGKFVTPAGKEVIETRDNWNYSRSLLFASAIPRDHTGVRAAYKASDRLVVTGFLVNGWNNVRDNNGAKSAGVSVTGKPTTDLTLTGTYIGGPETTDDNSGARHLLDAVLSYNISERTVLGANYDLGSDQHTLQQWQGAALYLRYQAREWLAAATRFEIVSDPDGFMTGIAQRAGEFTVTAEIKYSIAVMRVEYRLDVTQQPFFLKNASETVLNQPVLTLGWIVALGSKRP